MSAHIKHGLMGTDVFGPEHCVSVSQEVLRDARLSMRAKGLLLEMASYGPEFAASVAGIAARAREGTKAIAATLVELEGLGYLSRTQECSASGTFGPIRYSVSPRFAVAGSASQGESSPYGVTERLALDTSGWAYAVTEGPDAPVKIGKAQDLKARLTSLQTGSPRQLNLIWSAPGGRALEAHLHEVFKARRIRGEWFDFRDVDSVELISAAASSWGEAPR